MKVLVQRVISSSVEVEEKTVGSIDKGLLLLVGFTEGDSQKEIDYMVDILSVSQFTLYADASKGRRPSYINALGGEKSIVLYDEFNKKLRDTGVHIETGIFGEEMKVSLINDGQITIMLEK